MKKTIGSKNFYQPKENKHGMICLSRLILIKKSKREEYFKAVSMGIDRNYLLMESIFKEVFKTTINSLPDK